MRKKSIFIAIPALLALLAFYTAYLTAQEEKEPAVVTALEGQAPSDAIVLFGGKDLSEWTYQDGRPAGWSVADGAMTVKGGGIVTKRQFGDIQLHVEFATPAPAKGEGQDRGNSGVYLQGNYEVQVLDSYGNKTYIDGMCGAIYKISPPLVNASRPAGVWQTYDIVFRAAKFDNGGKLTSKPNVTVLHNGVLIQDRVEVEPTGSHIGNAETPRGPIFLQDHNHPVKYRNIWVREL